MKLGIWMHFVRYGWFAALAVFFAVAPLKAQRIYSSSGSFTARWDGDRLYSESGRYTGRLDGSQVYGIGRAHV